MTELEAGWHPDPTGRHEHRYWDGSAWTDHAADAGVATEDPYEAPADEPTTVDPAPAADDAPQVLTWNPGARAEPTTAATPTPTPAEPTASGWTAPPEPEPQPEPAAPTPSATGWASPGATSSLPTTLPTPDEVVDALPVVPAAAPADPAPPETPLPPGTGDGSGDGPGASKRKKVLLAVGAVVLVGIIAGIAIASQDKESKRDEIAGRLADSIEGNDPEASDADVDCIADYIVDKLGPDALDGVDFDQTEPLPGEDGAALMAAYAEAAAECEVDLTAAQPDVGDTTTDEPLSVDEQTEQYLEQFEDLDETQAECLAKADEEVRSRTDSLTTEEILAYVDACGVDREVLGIPDDFTTETTQTPVP